LLIGFIVSFILIYIANKNLVHPILLAWSISIFVFEFYYEKNSSLFCSYDCYIKLKIPDLF
jgi:hypothetical protein